MTLNRSLQFGYFWYRWKWLIVVLAATTVYLT
jgi:hypothetical protein